MPVFAPRSIGGHQLLARLADSVTVSALSLCWPCVSGQCESGGSCARRGRDPWRDPGRRTSGAAARATEPTDSARLHRVLGQGRRAHAPRVCLRRGWALRARPLRGCCHQLLRVRAAVAPAVLRADKHRAPYEYFRKQGTFTRDARHHVVSSCRLSSTPYIVAVLLGLLPGCSVWHSVGSGPCIRPVLRAGQPAASASPCWCTSVMRLTALAAIPLATAAAFLVWRPASFVA